MVLTLMGINGQATEAASPPPGIEVVAKGTTPGMNLDALRSRSFRIYLFGNLFAVNALWMQRITIGWIGWDLTGSASFVGFLALLFFVPTIVTGPIFGVLIDRVNVAAAGFATQGLLLLLTLLTLALEAAGWLGAAALVLFSTLSGVVTSMHHPVRMSLAPRLVPLEALASVVTFQSLNFNLARITGPALGGWCIAEIGVDFALLLQAVFFVPVLIALPRLRVRSVSRTDRKSDPFLQALGWGVRYVFANRIVLHTLLVTALVSLASRGVLETLPVISGGVFERGAQGLGVLTASAGVGAIGSSVLMAILPPSKDGRMSRVTLGLSWLSAGLVPALGVAGSWEAALLLVGAMGFASTVSAIGTQTAIQSQLADDARGRVMSLWVMVGIGGAGAGGMLLGLAADAFGIEETLIWGGGAIALILGGIAMRSPQTRSRSL